MTVPAHFDMAERWFLDVKTGSRSRSLRTLTSGARIVPESLAWFLAVGFIPGTATLFDGISCLPQGVGPSGQSDRPQVDGHFPYERLPTTEFLDAPEPDLVREGIRRWSSSVEHLYANTAGSPVVPLSGGIDSRAILCALLDFVEARNILTYTFGVPGTWDYEIGCRIAAHAGTKHTAYDLTHYEFTEERLAKIADLSDASCNLFCHAPYDWIVRDFGRDDVAYWIGFMGDPSAGSHIASAQALHELGEQYTLENNRYANSIKLEELLNGDYAPQRLRVDLPETPSGSSLSPHELWDFKNRQERYVAPIVLLRGLNYATPFLAPQWLRFSLSLPLRLRQNQSLYKTMLLQAYPDMFSLPLKNNMGLPLNAGRAQVMGARIRGKAACYLERLLGWKSANLGTNYIAFDRGLRDRSDLHGVVEGNLENLKKRDLLDAGCISRLWVEHKRGRDNHEKALTLLASLEIILRAFSDD